MKRAFVLTAAIGLAAIGFSQGKNLSAEEIRRYDFIASSGAPSAGNVERNRELTRMQAARVVTRSVETDATAIRLVRSGEKTFESGDLVHVWFVIQEQRSLVHALAPELAHQKVNPKAVLSRLDALEAELISLTPYESLSENQRSLKVSRDLAQAYLRLRHLPVYARRLRLPDDIWYGWRAPTRYEAALIVHTATLEASNALASVKNQDGKFQPADLIEIARELPAQTQLVKEFSEELARLGLCPQNLLGELERIRVAIPIWTQYELPSWVKPAFKEMHSMGMAVAYAGHVGRHPGTRTRYEFAVATHATYVHTLDRLKEDESIKPAFLRAVQMEIDSRYLFTLERLAREFSWELNTLGVDMPSMLGSLTALQASSDAQWKPERLATWAHG